MTGERLIIHNTSVTYFGREADDEKRRSILAQGLSAVIKYPRGRRASHQDFKPFVLLTQPQAPKLLAGELAGRWDRSGDVFMLESIDIKDARGNIWEMLSLTNVLAHLYPATPQLCSDSFEEILAQSWRIVTVVGTQESAFSLE